MDTMTKMSGLGKSDAALRSQAYSKVLKQNFSGYSQTPLLSTQYFNASVSAYVKSFASNLVPVKDMKEPEGMLGWMDFDIQKDNREKTVLVFPPARKGKVITIPVYQRGPGEGYVSFYITVPSPNSKHQWEFEMSRFAGYQRGVHCGNLLQIDEECASEVDYYEIAVTMDRPLAHPRKKKFHSAIRKWILGITQPDTTCTCSTRWKTSEKYWGNPVLSIVSTVTFNTAELPEGSWLRGILENYDCTTEL